MNERKIKRGQIYFVEISGGERGYEMTKNRPCVVVSSDRINQEGRVISIVPLSTCEQFDKLEHVSIRATARPNTALCEHIRAVDASRLGKVLGACSDREMQMINAGLAVTLGIEQVDIVAMQAAARAEARAEMGSGNGEVDTAEFIRVRTERDLYRKLYEDLIGRVGGNIVTVDVPIDVPAQEPEKPPKKEPERTVFAYRLRGVLVERGMSQMDLAHKTGISHNIITKYCNDRIPRGSNTVKIAKALRVSTDYLLGLSDKK